ncbi:MAG: hypothetical protein AAGA68_12685 [Pseudomonadota bacterium]
MPDQKTDAKNKLLEVFDDALQHNGFGEIRVEMRILKRRQKEVIVHYGRQYRFLVDYDNDSTESPPTPPVSRRAAT